MKSQKTTVLFAALLCCITTFCQKPQVISIGAYQAGDREQFGRISSEWYEDYTVDDLDFEGVYSVTKNRPHANWNSYNSGIYLTTNLIPDRWEKTQLILESGLGYSKQHGHNSGHYDTHEVDLATGVQTTEESYFLTTHRTGIEAWSHTSLNRKWRGWTAATGAGIRVGQVLDGETRLIWQRSEYIKEGMLTEFISHDDTMMFSPIHKSTSTTLYLPLALGYKFLDRMEVKWQAKIGVGYEFTTSETSRAIRRYWSSGLILAWHLSPHNMRSLRKAKHFSNVS